MLLCPEKKDFNEINLSLCFLLLLSEIFYEFKVGNSFPGITSELNNNLRCTNTNC